MRRRSFIAGLGSAAAWPVVAWAQRPAMPVIGILAAAPALVDERRMSAFRRGLGEIGYVVDRTVAIAYLQADGQYARLAALAADLVQRQVQVIVTPNSGRAASAAKAATAMLPIVFSTAADPVRLGLVKSLARPGGNLTGVYNFSTDLVAKRLGLLRELVPATTDVAVLVNPANPVRESGLLEITEAARGAGLSVRVLKASTIIEIDAALETLAREATKAFMVVNDPLFTSRRTRIVELAARLAVPAIYSVRDYADAGGLMSYSANYLEVYQQLGRYAGRILKGEKPADLPIVQPTTFELVINLRTAKALGLEIPPQLLARADEVIE